MTFTTALFDIHPGDRRQLERIFDKETTARKADGNTIYTEAFGSTDSLLLAPLKFDLFLVDCATKAESPDGAVNIEVARKIRESGCIAPIVLFFEEGIPLPEASSLESIEDVDVFQKPITTAFIRQTLDRCIEEKRLRTPRYEVRGDKATYYVYPSEVLYAIANGNSVDVYLTEGRYVRVLEPMSYIFKMFEKEVTLQKAGRKILINVKHITSSVGNTFLMSDDHRINVSLIDHMRLKNIWLQNLS